MSTMYSKNDVSVQTSIFKTIFTWKRSMYRTTWKAMIVWRNYVVLKILLHTMGLENIFQYGRNKKTVKNVTQMTLKTKK